MTQVRRCSGPGCDSWTSDARMLADWLTVIVLSGDGQVWHFCCGWCMTRWGADRFEPTEVIDA